MKGAVVLYPAPGIGHLVPMVELGKLIVSRYGGDFSVIVLLTTGPFDSPATTSYIDRISRAASSISFHRFPYLSYTPPSSPQGRLADMFEFLSRNASNVLQSLQRISQASSIRALILDSFCTSAFPLARGLGIPTFYYVPFSAAALAAILYLPTLHEQTSQSFKDLTDTFFRIPGLPPLRATHMATALLDRNGRSYQEAMRFSLDLRKCDGILINTFVGLEPRALKAISEEYPSVYSVGSLIADDGEDDKHRDDCLSWLDGQPSRSVVFLCFGSRGSLCTDQVKEMANGLERSGERFLWAVRSSSAPAGEGKSKETREDAAVEDFDLVDMMPEGFLDRTKGRGMVVKSWVPQRAILKHQSVGGFVTHCGWNSVLEAVAGGVPMVAWPLRDEQRLNRVVLVEDMKLAIGVEQRDGDGFVSGAELERRVKELMSSTELRKRMKEVKEMAAEARREEGSSIDALDKLTHVWKQA